MKAFSSWNFVQLVCLSSVYALPCNYIVRASIKIESGVDFITVLHLICTLRPTFEKLLKGVERALRPAPNFDRPISMFCALRPTFMKSTPSKRLSNLKRRIILLILQLILLNLYFF